MNQEVIEWASFTLQEYERRRCIAKVLRFECRPAVAKGENYASDIQRIHLEVLLNSGEIEQKSFICKRLPQGETARQIVKKSNVFIKESRTYRDVLAVMDNIVQKITPGAEPFSARWIGSKGNSEILLEDLKPCGYKLACSRRGLDFDHCAIVMKTLGKFHALGAILIENGELSIDEYKEYQFVKNEDFYDPWYRNNFKGLAWILENKWKGEWLQYAPRLRKTGESAGGDLHKLFITDESRFNTLLHGDCNINNLMFKYDHEGRPVAVRLVDFQLCVYNSIGFDLNFFLWVCPNTDARAKTPELIRLYHESLCNHLRIYGFQRQTPSLESVILDCERTALFGLVMAVLFLEYQMQSRSDVPDVDEMAAAIKANPGQFSSINKVTEKTRDFERTMQYLIKEAANSGLI